MVYCVSDIHGCYDEFMDLVEQIEFNPDNDILWVLGDVIDRGDRNVDCLRFIMKTKNEHMMFTYLDGIDLESWFYNGGEEALKENAWCV